MVKPLGDCFFTHPVYILEQGGSASASLTLSHYQICFEKFLIKPNPQHFQTRKSRGGRFALADSKALCTLGVTVENGTSLSNPKCLTFTLFSLLSLKNLI